MEPSISTVDFVLGTYKVYDADLQADVDKDVKGQYYTVSGVEDGNHNPRPLSMAELVMVICLARAGEKEEAVIDLMKQMSNTTATLNSLTDIESRLLDGKSLSTMTGSFYYNGTTYTKAIDFLRAVGINITTWSVLPGIENVSTPIDDIISDIESKMDSMNSFSQEKMIELQSETNKRDQAYDMITNILKSLNSTEMGIVNNI